MLRFEEDVIRTINIVADCRYVVGTRLIPVVAERRADGTGARAAQVLRLHLRHVGRRRREVEARRNLGRRPHDGR